MKNTKIIYVGDPMCSWCYGVSDHILALHEHYQGAIDFEIVMGGLRPYNTETMADLKDFLTHHWEDVHHASGQEFNYGILDSTTITYDTEPPCRAVVCVRSMDASKELRFFKMIQRDFYLKNKNMHLAESYQESIQLLGLNFESFKRLFESPEMKQKVKLDFQRAASLGVRSFPSILIEINGKRSLLASGYATKEQMIGRVEALK